MKLKRKGLLFSIIGFVVILFVARLTGVYQFYDVPTGSMEPALSPGTKLLATNLKGPKKNNIILFTTTLNERFEFDRNGEKSTFCSRLIALSGDTIQLKNGYAYINSVLVDDTTLLKFTYALSSKDYNNLLTALEIDPDKNNFNYGLNIIGDTAYAFISYDQYARIKDVIQVRRIEGPVIPERGMYNKTWTVDNFGPYVVPPNHFFFLGDNRHNANDSRYIGPIPLKNYKGTLIVKF
jgi:signal peptidase I